MDKIEIKQKEHKSFDWYELVQSSIHLYENEDQYYCKPQNVEEWYNEWDFKEYNPNIYSHGFHQYPAKFIPQLVRKLLRVFSDENSIILDNFMGSGTTLVESILLNRRKAIGIELNPFACFIAKVKTTSINPTHLIKNFLYIKNELASLKNVNLHKFYNIEFWFKEKQIYDLSKLREVIISISDENIKNFFLLCFSEVVRRVSLTNHNGFKLHRDKNKLTEDFNPNTFGYFDDIVERNIALMQKFYLKSTHSKTEIQIIHGDTTIKQNIGNNTVDLILTSPPYGDSRTTVAYGQFSRLSWQWIKNDNSIFKVDESLLGGKIKKSKTNILDASKVLEIQYNSIKENNPKRADEVLSFYIDLYESLKNAREYLNKNKYFILVTGNRTVKNTFLKTDLIVSELSNQIGFKTEKILSRNIINKRMPRLNSPTNIKGDTSATMLKENIIFLRKKQ